jgi:Xaa-Pro dipeptidase
MNLLFKNADCIVIANVDCVDENFFYFTKLLGMWENSYAVVYPDRVEVIAPPLDKGDVHTYRGTEELVKTLVENVAGDRIGFNGRRLPVRQLRWLKKTLGGTWTDVTDRLDRLHAIKKPDEIRSIRRANKISRLVVDGIEFDDKTERQIAWDVTARMHERHATPAFGTIVAFGKNSATPHHIPGGKKPTFPALVDLGARVDGYASDITRSFVKRRGRSLYETVEGALALAIDSIAPGVSAASVFDRVQRSLNRAGYGMLHALGHSIGLLVHDGFSISANADFAFEENMVFAVEPAVYTRRFGIRIEEDLVVTRNGAAVMR